MTATNMIKRDCRHYLGDRPCGYHKGEGVKCAACSYYAPVSDRILIIKLDAVGDVLRTTSILAGLTEKYPNSQVYWITAASSLPVLVNNPFIDCVLPLQPDGILSALTRTFSLSINLDTSPRSCDLHKLVDSEKKLGFSLDERGAVTALSPPAEEWLKMSVFDDVKKKNRKTCQTIMREIAELPPPDGKIILRLTPAEKEFARDFSGRNNLGEGNITIGFNTGAGPRWRYKKWGEENTLRLIRDCSRIPGVELLLFGGPEEKERNRRLFERAPENLVDTGTDNSLRHFFALLTLCDILITSDTLALHAAAALDVEIVALFGPTSAPEIDLYGRGEKIITPLDCRCCYLPDCDRDPDCMSAIGVEKVLAAVKRRLTNRPTFAKSFGSQKSE